ncbi:DUF6314 family protein [Francisella philomiragia]|uniref:DUF6314 family protein n=1 Tax=Francisella philomiragia TaxID=28110 RepID=UPI001907B848|nr:DUF6314 family protein [Francisella philomiragia]MBK2092993.1 hypothetical protein [Francisella philomiragia]MBK2256879.1 hypothetical protein [Francisella philomiragia]MBK2269537.1 hypothetical protein [Francisella philomiragia]MBK2271098.1 hypothetical protein [Francisella philomiragia]MBK2274878.1 hypothetical protein [Francisella philomiragia]
MELFSKLINIRHFKYESKSGKKSQTGWNGHGHGTVITHQNDNCIYFKEEGSFILDGSEKLINISNEYIWQKINSQRISLSHARFGYNNLVKLFDLIRIDDNLWQSEQAHVCVDDLYSAQLYNLESEISLVWKISGPKKDELINYKYTF